MKESKALTIIVPALNEEQNIRPVCEALVRSASQCLSSYEILVFDDASQDGTADVVNALRKKYPQITLIQNPVTRGLGDNYRDGAFRARFDFMTMVPGDNEVVVESLQEMFRQLGSADLLLGHFTNPEVRPWARRVISRLYVRLVNFLFGLKARYYNGPSIVRTDLVRRFLPKTNSFAYMTVVAVQAIKAGYRYQEMPLSLRERRFGRSKAFRLKNVVRVLRDLGVLYWKLAIWRSRQAHGKQEAVPR